MLCLIYLLCCLATILNCPPHGLKVNSFFWHDIFPHFITVNERVIWMKLYTFTCSGSISQSDLTYFLTRIWCKFVIYIYTHTHISFSSTVWTEQHRMWGLTEDTWPVLLTFQFFNYKTPQKYSGFVFIFSLNLAIRKWKQVSRNRFQVLYTRIY